MSGQKFMVAAFIVTWVIHLGYVAMLAANSAGQSRKLNS